MKRVSKITSSELIETMNEIVNIRKYMEQPIPKNVETDLFHAFSLGYSSGNTQPWEILVIEKDEGRKKVVQATLGPYLMKDTYGAQAWIGDAPFVCIAMIEKRRALARIGEEALSFANQDIAFAIQNFRLIAHAHQLRTACVREFDKELLRKKLELPWYIDPVAILTAGYGERKKDLPPRLAQPDFVKRGEWY